MTFILQLAQEKYDVGLVTNPSLPSLDFLEEIDLQFGITPSGTTKVALLRSLNDRLVANLREGKETVLVVDEAHCIRDPDVFEELRMLLNFQLNDRFLLTLILMAQPEITDMIGRIKPLDQRIAIRHHLKPLSQAEAAAYVAFRMQRAGAAQSPFDDEAIRLDLGARRRRAAPPQHTMRSVPPRRVSPRRQSRGRPAGDSGS